MVNKFNKKDIISFLPILILILFMLLVLPSSPFRSGNTWDDTNAMLRIGQLWKHGILPFRDVSEQRGLCMYLFYMIANLISETGYIGLFIIEAINLVAIQIITKKVIDIYFNEERKMESIVGSTIVTLLIMCNFSFKNGGSPEEFSIFWIMLSVLGLQKYFKNMNEKDFFLVGVSLAVVFNIKYSLIGPWAGIGIIAIWRCVKRPDRFKRLVRMLGFGILGMLTILFPLFVYLIATKSLGAFIQTYFIQNITNYTQGTLPFTQHLIQSLSIGYSTLAKHNALLLLAFAISICLLSGYKRRMTLLSIFTATQLLTYWSLRSMDYMALISVYMMYVAVALVIIEKVKHMNVPVLYMGLAVVFVGLIFSFKNLNPSFELSVMDQVNQNITSYKFAKKIDELGGGKTLLYCDSIDFGVERYTEVPNTFRYFEKTNLNLREKDISLANTVAKQKADFIIVNEQGLKRPVLKGKYKVVSSSNRTKYYFVDNFKGIKQDKKVFLMQSVKKDY